MFLEVKNISKIYSDKFVLNKISFSQKKGEVISIIGASGEGKTTLLNCLSGLIKPDSGSIKLNSNKIDNLNANKRNIAYVFQESPLFPHLNILQNILFNLKDYKKELLNDLVNKTSIQLILEKYPHEISGGENQRVAVVRSLIRNPDLFLLDEPFSNLDKNNKKILKEILFEIIKEKNLTTIMVNHDIKESLEMSDRIMIIDDGKINTLDKPEVIYSNPKNLKIANLFGELNSFTFDKKKIFIRPENLNIVSKSQNKIIVNSCIYLGNKYRIEASYGIEKIFLFDKKKYKVGSELFFDFNKNFILSLD